MSIKIQGARTHNLKNINLEIPRDALVVITGLSGSGKSSLAFDTLYAEGQRRYVESLSAYARQFLGMMEKPDVDSIEGLSPAISIDQKTTSKNPRSTVGTVTEIHDYLRLLFARVGHTYCPNCQIEIEGQSLEQIVEQITHKKDLIVASPLVRDRKGEHSALLRGLIQEGFTRVFIDETLYKLEDTPSLDKQKKHTISLVIDRLQASSDNKNRLSHSTSLALEKSGGLVEIHYDGKTELHSKLQSCPQCSYSAPEMEPRLFSFNSPHGACSLCQGLGHQLQIDPDLIVLDPDLSVEDGALESFEKASGQYDKALLSAFLDHTKIDISVPWKKLSKKQQKQVLFGSKDKIDIVYKNRFGGARQRKGIPFPGIVPRLQRRYDRTESEWRKENLSRLLTKKPCPECLGQRLSSSALSVKIADKNIADVSALDIENLWAWISSLQLSEQEKEISRLLLKEIESRVSFLLHVGLTYLSLDRAANTLSGGESQRIRLATQIGSQLVGVLYILDEPSIGLHPRDNDKLLATLKNLRDLGNSVLVVEHDEATMFAADRIIDIGPLAGEGGGEVVAEGDAQEIMKSGSLTGDFLSGKRFIPVPAQRRAGLGEIKIFGASSHNLKSINATFKIGAMNCLTGVSGSGKSTLVTDTLYPALENILGKSRKQTGRYKKITGAEKIDKVIQIDQSPIGRTPRSNPATYTGLFDPIRSLFAGVPESRARGYKPGRFSFNVAGGRCETCRGDGEIRIEMHFLPDVYVPCEECGGQRYNKETLEIHYKGKNIAEVLQMPVAEALHFFQKISKIHRRLKTLSDVGLGYIRLGQAATTLSGGEAQRVKLATELSRVSTGDTLYLLDEPTTGLHFADVEKLLSVLNRLVENKNTVLVIEHNLDVIKSADWIIDLGPEGGRDGGKIVALGTPEKVAESGSYTGEFLKQCLK